MNERPHALRELEIELDRAARRELTGSARARLSRLGVLAGTDGPLARLRLSRRGVVADTDGPLARLRLSRRGVVAVAAAGLLLVAAAAAAVLLIQQGSPLPSPHAADLSSSGGIPLSGSARLAGLDAPDPGAGEPPWDVRISRTKDGETCTAVGQVLGGRFGIVGLDHVFRELPLGGVDACGVASADGPILAGAHEFIGRTAGEYRTVVSGLAGPGARSATAYAAGSGARHLSLGADGSFITVYAGEAEAVRPRIVVVGASGDSHTLAFEQSDAFEVPDTQAGKSWTVSAEPDLEPGAFADEDCVQASRQPSQTEPSHFGLPLTPSVCGRLAAQPVVVLMRRFVPGEDSPPFPWNDSPSRTLVYGIAAPRVKSLELTGAGAPRTVTIDRQGGAFLAVLDGHVDPRALKLAIHLRNGTALVLHHSTALLSQRTNKPLGEAAVPAWRAQASSSRFDFPPFELPIRSTVRETLRAQDPAGGPTWVLRSWQAKPNPAVRGSGRERYLCTELGVLAPNGKLVEASAKPTSTMKALSYEHEAPGCTNPKIVDKHRYAAQLQAFVSDPYSYAPSPGRTVFSGQLPVGASGALLYGAEPTRLLPVDANGAFLIVLAGHYWDARLGLSYRLDGKLVRRSTGSERVLSPPRSTGRLAVPGARAPDPDGGAPWGFAATPDCHTAVGRIVDGRLATLVLHDGLLTPGPESTGWSSGCLTHPNPRFPARHESVEFDMQPDGPEQSPFDTAPAPLDQPEIEQRTLPGRTIITGVALPDVESITLVTPSDVRTLRPSGPDHTVIAVYDGLFLRGKVSARIRRRDGRTVNESIPGEDYSGYQQPSLAEQLALARHTLARGGKAEGALMRGRVRQMEARLSFTRSHPGLLPAE
ncbi:MAG TPA: hypothetical protein VGG08_11685 [Solirubrobacteraceae bacterium]